jgi:hypothetical protein
MKLITEAVFTLSERYRQNCVACKCQEVARQVWCWSQMWYPAYSNGILFIMYYHIQNENTEQFLINYFVNNLTSHVDYLKISERHTHIWSGK